MLNSAAFLLLAVVCLSSWAAPLGSIIPSDGSCCHKQQQRVPETPENPERHEETSPGAPLQEEDRRLTEENMITRTPSASLNPETMRGFLFYLPLLVSDSTDNSFTLNTSLTATSGNTLETSSPGLPTAEISSQSSALEAQDGPGPVEEEAVLGSRAHAGLGSVTAVGNGGSELRLDDPALWTETQSVVEQHNTSTPASGESFVDHFLVSVNTSTAELFVPLATPTIDLQREDPFNTEDAESSNRPSEIGKGKSDDIQTGHFHERYTEDETALTKTPLQEKDRRLEADTTTRTLMSESSTGSFSLLPLTSDPAAPQTSLTVTSGDSLSGFTGVGLQDNTPVSGLHQPDRTLSSTSLDVAEAWTETVHLQRAEVSVEPSPQELDTMSSEVLPLIFEPLEEGTSPRDSEMSVSMTPTAATVEDVELERMVSMETKPVSSDVPLSGLLDWPPSWLPSGREKTDDVTVTETDRSAGHHGKTQNDDITQTSVTQQTVTVSEVVWLPTSKPKTDTEDLESKEEPDEEEDDEGLDSDEEESEEDLAETSMAPSNRPPYSLIPPPPVWVQRNQGLVRSWVELIREKAGYVSGMLAPVGIGIAGALLLVGALYSIRVIHRKRRENFKHQRRRPPREVRTGPDNTMLLADSSEDEF